MDTVYTSMRGLSGKNAGQINEVAAYAREHKADLRTVGLDVQTDASAQSAMAAIIAEHGRLDVLIHNAGHNGLGATAEGLGTVGIMRRTGRSKPCVWRWQERFVAEGVAGPLRDKMRPSRKPPLSAEVKLKLKVLTKTANEMPANATHWSVRSMARAVGIGHTSVQRIWAEAGLKPHLVGKFKLSNDPNFVEKITDMAGL